MQKVAAVVVLLSWMALVPDSEAAPDTRATTILDLNSPRKFAAPTSREEWQSEAEKLRQHILVSCGLWPMPEKTPLHAKISGRIDHDGYSVENVSFESSPGFFVVGNLYRPRGSKGPYPAILNPHGHWAHGRLTDEKDGSIPARCINFAKQGYVAFAYDMVGYNDTCFADQKAVTATATNLNFYPRHREFAVGETNLLWNISLMGLQTWDSIRALDFLQSLPDVDKKRIGLTGASGGATQTIILGAIDPRITVQAPVCMVSSIMQGGCACETAPGLRLDHSNMEIAALPAPRPQLLVAATGDWTKMTLTFEGPAVGKAYQQFGAEEKLRYVIGDFGHNYNKSSREQVYDWFATWLKPAHGRNKEVAYQKDSDEQLRMFPDGKLPDGALSQDAFLQNQVKAAEKRFRDALPKNAASLAAYKKTFLPAWRETFALTKAPVAVDFGSASPVDEYLKLKVSLAGTQRGDHVPAILFTAAENRRNTVVVLAHPKGMKAFLQGSVPTGLAKRLLDRGASVIVLDTFLTGELADDKAAQARADANKKQTGLFFSCYNRTDIQERVQDLITACEFARSLEGNPRVILCGVERAGLWATLAAPAADVLIADCDQLETSSDKELLKPDIFVPGLRKIGGFEGVALLAAPNPILLHNTGEKFSYETLTEVYGRVKALPSTRVKPNRLSDDEIMQWIGSLRDVAKR